MLKMFVVKGSNGNGLDYSEWIEKFYLSRLKAEEELKFLFGYNEKNDYWIDEEELDDNL